MIKKLLQHDDEDRATIHFSPLGNLLSPKSLHVDFSRGKEKKGSAPPPSSSFEPLIFFVDGRLGLPSDRLSRSLYSD